MSQCNYISILVYMKHVKHIKTKFFRACIFLIIQNLVNYVYIHLVCLCARHFSRHYKGFIHVYIYNIFSFYFNSHFPLCLFRFFCFLYHFTLISAVTSYFSYEYNGNHQESTSLLSLSIVFKLVYILLPF